MNILHIHPSFTCGGVETFLATLMNEQSRYHSVSFCTWAEWDEGMTDPRLLPGIHRLSLHHKTLSKKNLILDEFRLLFLIWKGKYDVVHLHGYFDYYLLAAFLLHRRTRFVYTIHTEVAVENNRIRPIVLSLKRYFFSKRWITPVILTQRFQADFERLYACQAFVVGNGMARPQSLSDKTVLDDLSLGRNTTVFIHAGRICEAKNQLVLVRVFDRLIREGEDVALVIVGPLVDESIFAGMRPYFSERIVYAGAVDDVPSLMARADAMCLPSIREGFPITVLEAFSVGCIPICSPVGGILDMVVDGVSGFVSQSVSEEDYYQALRRYLRCDESTVKAMREGCFKAFEKFSISETRVQYDRVYTS